MKLHDLHSALETRIPRAYACEWDNDGLMCTPDLDAEVRRVLCTLDVTDDALCYAAEIGFDVVLSHHPLTEPFGDGESDMGRIGLLPAETDIYDFCAQIKRVLHADALLLAKAHDTAYRVAVLGGDGKDFIRGAIAAGADTYVSGRLSYNTMAEAAEMGITLIEAGHFYTENIICAYYLRLLAALGIPGACYDSNRIEIA